MSRLVASELLKLRTTRTIWAVALPAVGLSLLSVVIGLAVSAFRDAGDVAALFTTGNLGGLLVLILGIVGVTGEHRHGTITPTFLITPDRARVVLAKAIAYGLAGVAITLAIDLVVAAIALPWLSIKGSPGPDAGDLALLLAGGSLYGALAGPLGVGIGALVGQQVAAVVITLLELLAFEPVLSGLAPDVARYAPQAAAGALASGGLAPGLTLWAGGLVYLAWAAAFVAAGALREGRRDVS